MGYRLKTIQHLGDAIQQLAKAEPQPRAHDLARVIGELQGAMAELGIENINVRDNTVQLAKAAGWEL